MAVEEVEISVQEHAAVSDTDRIPALIDPFTGAASYGYHTVASLLAAVNAAIAALAPISSVNTAQYTADDARMLAMTAIGLSRDAKRAHQHDNAQGILHAQVFG